MKIAATARPTGGEVTSARICLPSDDHLTPSNPPAAAMPAPTSPPMSACVELLGRPRYQVRRLQAMAPIRAAITTTRPAFMASVPAMVLDTLAWKRLTVTSAPTRLNVAETITAWEGVIARVETEV